MVPFGMEVALTGLSKRGVRPAIVYDIGASDGSWTKLAATIWPNAYFHCFEPLDVRRGPMGACVRQFAGRVTHHPIGLSDTNAELSLAISDDLWGSSFAYGGVETQQAHVRTLDSLLAEGAVPAPDFVKIDVQGFERRVMEGGKAALRQCDFILMECTFYPFCAEMQRLDQSIAFMAEAGFAPYEIVDFLRRPADDAMAQCDILFIRRDHALMHDTRWA